MDKHASLLITTFLSGFLVSGFLVFLPEILTPKTDNYFTCLPGDCLLQSGLLYTLPIALLGGLSVAFLMIRACRILCDR